MNHPTTVSDVMTRDIVVAHPDTSFKDLVTLTFNGQIGAVPIIDRAGNVLGVVSEANLLSKEEHADDPPSASRSRFAGRRMRSTWDKSGGLIAAELMTAPVHTITSDTELPQAAREIADAWCLCVVDDGRLVGMVTRRDLLRPFLRSDIEIRREIDNDVFDQAVHANPTMVRATVEAGVVTLTGRVQYQGDVATAARLARLIPGVVAVRCRLDWTWNGERIDQTAAV